MQKNDPFYIQWHITNLCNLRCRHCYQDDFSRNDDLDGPALQKISDNILSTLKEWGTTACIHLTGGEPLLKPELFSLLDHLDRQETVEELGIITNGLLADREAMKRLSDVFKLKKIKISLDGADAETNDSIRSKRTFEQVIKNLSVMKHEKRFETILMFTVMKRNFRGLPVLFSLCQDIGIDGLIIERFIPLGRGKEFRDEVLGQKDWKEMIEMLSVLFPSEEEDQFFLPYQAFQVDFRGEEPELLGASCVIGLDGFCIMPDGSVFPCRRFPVPIGNLWGTPLKKIWDESELLKKLRKKENLKGKCGICGMKDCRGCRSLALALTGDPFAEDSHCNCS